MVHVHRLRMSDTDVDRLFKSRIREVDRGEPLAGGRLNPVYNERSSSPSGTIPWNAIFLSNRDPILLTKNEGRKEGRIFNFREIFLLRSRFSEKKTSLEEFFISMIIQSSIVFTLSVFTRYVIVASSLRR